MRAPAGFLNEVQTCRGDLKGGALKDGACALPAPRPSAGALRRHGAARCDAWEPWRFFVFACGEKGGGGRRLLGGLGGWSKKENPSSGRCGVFAPHELKDLLPILVVSVGASPPPVDGGGPGRGVGLVFLLLLFLLSTHMFRPQRMVRWRLAVWLLPSGSVNGASGRPGPWRVLQRKLWGMPGFCHISICGGWSQSQKLQLGKTTVSHIPQPIRNNERRRREKPSHGKFLKSPVHINEKSCPLVNFSSLS